MFALEWLAILACAGHIFLAIVTLQHRARSPVALPLSLLCFDLFVWNFAQLSYRLSGYGMWHLLDVGTSWLTPPLTLHFILAFVGRLRRLRWALVASYLAFAAMVPFNALSDWDLLLLAAIVPNTSFGLVLLVTHYRTCHEREEKVRTAFIAAALLIGTVLGSMDLWYDHLPFQMPAIGGVWLFATTLVVTIAALRFRLLGVDPSRRAVVTAAALGAIVVVAYLGVLHRASTATAATVLMMATLGTAVGVAVREALAGARAQRERSREVVTLGRFSRQLAHDLKNPIAALRGSLQFLEGERTSGRSIDGQERFFDLMREQVERLGRVVDRYQRVAGVEPVRVPWQINRVIESVTALQTHVAPGITIRTELDPTLPRCALDADLLAAALDNLLTNALDASQAGGTITIRTALSPTGPAAVILSVEDTGVGMDARQREHAFDEFFTTKADGTGLGLPFVRRVAEAHGGTVSLSSEPGRGTVVRVCLPCDDRPREAET